MRDVAGPIRERGAGLYVVGSGSTEQALDFARERGLDFDLFVDPELASFRAAGLRRNLASNLSPRVFTNAARSMGKGFRQGLPQGDLWQQGGALVIAAGGGVQLSQVSRSAGDHVDPDDLLRALDGLPAPPQG